ncbi:EndoU domain-containing protein [Leptolyngbya sp. FACHB-36]|uniref:EndoU domain-containing protein n=1 Tax=Leptolyngbya sp. FACHB-36 TaxID=2692808 RepID=UPI0016813B8A|nr:EndoU domain-containing protein [Leptolyngbya sp. FACHB-36]MBD2020459.1 EndoU domain-containing protein [Leptolyngbya sp. FACHB-36]
MSWVAELAQAQIPASGTFTATQPCPAQQTIRGQNPDSVQLTVGERYQTVGFNSQQRSYILLRVPGASPVQRWVSVSCGEFQAANGSPAPTPGRSPQPTPRTSPSALLPFFDNETNPVPVENDSQPRDITPPPPKLESFDQKILALCGSGFDASVSDKSFRQLISFYPDVVSKLKQATGGELFPGRRSDAQFLDDLTTIWFKYKGFKHIFCGEKDGNSIGGLHFHGRYLTLQNEGIGGRITRTSKGQDAAEEVVDGAIYTLGVAIVQNDRLVAEHRIKGYSYALNAQRLLIDTTQAFKQFKVPSSAPRGESVACLYTVSDTSVKPFQAVFVKKDNSIRTFYPDATPGDSRTTGPCNR